MSRLERFGVLVVAVLALMLGGNLAAYALTPNDRTCRAAVTIPYDNGEVVAYNACRFDQQDAQLAAIRAAQASGTPTSSPTPSQTPSVTPSATPTPTPTPTPSPTPSPASCSTVKFTGQGSDTVVQPGSHGGTGWNISAEQWGVKAGYKSTLYYCGLTNWAVDIKSVNSGDGAVQSYPSLRYIYHDYSKSGFASDPALSTFPQLKVSFDITSPTSCPGCVYETAFDNWLNGIASPYDAQNNPNAASTEQMIWLHNVGQQPYGSKVKSGVTIDGRQWDVWTGLSNSYVAFVPASSGRIDAGTVDVKAFTQYQVANKLLGPNTTLSGAMTDPRISQVSLGVEPVGMNGERFDFRGTTLADT